MQSLGGAQSLQYGRLQVRGCCTQVDEPVAALRLRYRELQAAMKSAERGVPYLICMNSSVTVLHSHVTGHEGWGWGGGLRASNGRPQVRCVLSLCHLGCAAARERDPSSVVARHGPLQKGTTLTTHRSQDIRRSIRSHSSKTGALDPGHRTMEVMSTCHTPPTAAVSLYTSPLEPHGPLDP